MKVWRPIGYIFVSSGIFLLLFFTIIDNILVYPLNQINPELAQTTFFALLMPWIVVSSLCFIIGLVGLYAGRGETVLTTEEVNQISDMKERINRLESIVDNNFIVIKNGLDKIEEQQKLSSQNSLIKAKKD